MPLSVERTKVDALGALVNVNNLPEGTSFGKTMPLIAVDNTAGEIFHMPALDKAATKGTEITVGGKRTTVVVTSAHVDYKLADRSSKRIAVGFDEEIVLGDLENVKELGGSRAAFAMWCKLEEDAWKTYKLCALGPEAPIVPGTLKKGTVRKQILDAARAVTRCGHPVLVATHNTITDLCSLPEIREHLVTVAKIVGDDGMVRNVAQPVARALADSLALDEVIEVADEYAPDEAAGCIYVIGRRPESIGAADVTKVAKAKPLTAAIVYNKPAEAPADEAPMCSIYCYAVNQEEQNFFDTQGRWIGLPLNGKAGCKLLTLAADLNDYEPGAPAAAAVSVMSAEPAAAPAAEMQTAEAPKQTGKK